MSMGRIVVLVILSLVILGAAFWGYQNFLAPIETPTPAPLATTQEPTEEIVSAEGVVVAARAAPLAFKGGGRVVEIHFQEGAQVKQNELLARLDDAVFQKQIEQARAQIKTAELHYQHAQAQVDVANKQLAQLKAGGTAEQVAAARAALDAAQAAYHKVAQGPTREQLAALKAQVDNAHAALAQAQSAYDRAGGASNPFIAQTREALQLEQATNAHNAALAAYTDALAHPTASELAAANASVQQARETLARLSPTHAQLETAQAQIVAAQRAADTANAQTQQARAALETLHAQADDFVLRAPFDGTLATKNIEVGQIVAPGAPVFLLGDLNSLQIETSDLAQVDAPRVQKGMTARITSDSFPEKTFSGTVTDIAPLASDLRGDKVFKAKIALDDEAKRALRWGMTVNVEVVVR